jgi:hypothetical protein
LIHDSIQDADYSKLGYMILQAMGKRPDEGKITLSDEVGAKGAESPRTSRSVIRYSRPMREKSSNSNGMYFLVKVWHFPTNCLLSSTPPIPGQMDYFV